MHVPKLLGGRTGGMLRRNNFEILDSHIGGNALKLSILLSPHYFFYHYKFLIVFPRSRLLLEITLLPMDSADRL